MLTEKNIQDNSKMISVMGMEFKNILKHYIKVDFLIILKMDLESKQNIVLKKKIKLLKIMKENFKEEKSTVKVYNTKEFLLLKIFN